MNRYCHALAVEKYFGETDSKLEKVKGEGDAVKIAETPFLYNFHANCICHEAGEQSQLLWGDAIVNAQVFSFKRIQQK